MSENGIGMAENPLLTILVDGIKKAFESPESMIDATDYPPTYRSLIDDQNKIGWIQLFRCRWTTEWRRQYSLWAICQSIPNPEKEAEKWIKRKDQVLLRQWWHLWKMRNDERHGRKEAEL